MQERRPRHRNTEADERYERLTGAVAALLGPDHGALVHELSDVVGERLAEAAEGEYLLAELTTAWSERLSVDQQRQVLAFVRTVGSRPVDVEAAEEVVCRLRVLLPAVASLLDHIDGAIVARSGAPDAHRCFETLERDLEELRETVNAMRTAMVGAAGVLDVA